MSKHTFNQQAAEPQALRDRIAELEAEVAALKDDLIVALSERNKAEATVARVEPFPEKWREEEAESNCKPGSPELRDAFDCADELQAALKGGE